MKKSETFRLTLIFIVLIAIALSLLLSGCNGNTNLQRTANDDIVINSDNFPDGVFRSWLMSPQNLNGIGADGVLTQEELGAVTEMVINRNGGAMITNLGGIEHFVNLNTLSITDNGLTSLDLRQNKQLTYVNCMYNRLTSLYVSELSNLETLFCEYNYLETLDLSGDVALKTLYSRHNLLKSLDLSDNTELVFIETFDNLIEEIDVSMLTKLEFLHIDHNRLTTLDMSHNKALQGGGFVVRNNDLRVLKLPEIESFTIFYDDFAEQDPIEGYERLEWFADESFTQPVTTDVEANGQTLYGKRLANRFTVSFDGNGAATVPSPLQGEYGQSIQLPSDVPQRRGYIFKGWSKNKVSTSADYQPSESVLNIGGKRLDGERVTLFAQWNPISYKVRFDATDGMGEMSEMSVRYGQSFNLSSNTFTRQGYDFVGWATSIGGPAIYRDGQTVSDLSYTEGETVVLYAVWERDAQSVRQPYEQQLNRMYSDIDKGNYLEEDRSAIDVKLADSTQKLVDAGKSEKLMKQIVADTESYFRTVMTRQQRVDEITSRWQQENIKALQIVATKPADVTSIDNSLQLVNSASETAQQQALARYSTLTHPQSLLEAVDIASTQLQSVKQTLAQFVGVAEWISGTKDAVLLPLSQATSDRYSHYKLLTEQLSEFDEGQLQYVAPFFTEGINERLQLAESKGVLIEQLTEQLNKYDESQYHPQQWEMLVALFNQGIAQIETSTSESAARQVVEQSVVNMDEVTFQPEIPLQPQPPVDEPANNTAVVWIVSLCLVAVFVIVVWLIVRKSRRNNL